MTLAKTAKKDIFVYKGFALLSDYVFRPNTYNKRERIAFIDEMEVYLCSMYRSFVYNYGKKHCAEIRIDPESFGRINIGPGFHSCWKLSEAEYRISRSNEVVLRVIIPKGAKYMVGTYRGELVSNEMIIPDDSRNRRAIKATPPVKVTPPVKFLSS